MEKKNLKNSLQDRPVLVLDCGTSGVKALVFKGDEIISKDYSLLRKSVSKKGAQKIVEQDPKEMVRASIKVLRSAVRKSKMPVSSFIGLGITNQRETTIIWDRKNGKAVHPAIVWEDNRTLATARKISAKFGKDVVQKTGLRPDAYFSATKIKYILDKLPKGMEKAERGELAFGTVDSWLLWNLGENNPHLTDHTNASRTLLFNIRKLSWDKELLKIFNIPSQVLPVALPSFSDYGFLKEDVLGERMPILAVCGDQEASLFAAGTGRGVTKITFGTGAFVAHSTGKDFTILPPFFTTLVPSNGKAKYMLEAKVDDCGPRITPLIGHDALMRKEVTRIMKKINPYIKRLPMRPRRIVVDGGVTQYGPLTDIHKDITGIPAVRQVIFDGTALGVSRIIYKHGR